METNNNNMSRFRKFKKRSVKTRLRNLERNIELKTADSVITTTATTTASFSELTNLAQGDTINQREGQEIQLQSIQIQGTVVKHASNTGFGHARFVVFVDMHNQDQTPAVGDLLTATAPLVNALFLTINRGRFRILMDQHIVYGKDAVPNFQGDVAFIKRFINYRGRVRYESASATSAQSGSLWVMVLDNEGTNGATFNVRIRIRYRG